MKHKSGSAAVDACLNRRSALVLLGGAALAPLVPVRLLATAASSAYSLPHEDEAFLDDLE
jgi:hypothetical protein